MSQYKHGTTTTYMPEDICQRKVIYEHAEAQYAQPSGGV
jgi:hypothetical protein